MAGVNKAIIVGFLGNDPELKHTPSGVPVANFSVATTETWYDKQKQKQESTEWHRIVVWNKQAENCAEYLKKGSQVYVEGKLQTRQWEDRDGNKRYTTEIKAMSVQFLSGGKQSGDRRPRQQQQQQDSEWNNQAPMDNEGLDNLPF